MEDVKPVVTAKYEFEYETILLTFFLISRQSGVECEEQSGQILHRTFLSMLKTSTRTPNDEIKLVVMRGKKV